MRLFQVAAYFFTARFQPLLTRLTSRENLPETRKKRRRLLRKPPFCQVIKAFSLLCIILSTGVDNLLIQA